MSIFQFKQFAVAQDQCAMKINTDSVLLAAWAQPSTPPQFILDIGTGTGVLALMMAQRFPDSKIIGIEIEEKSAQQAFDNIAKSPFKNRIEILHSSLQNFAALKDFQHYFDYIICNPPYFNAKKYLLANDKNYARQIARATLTLSFDELLKHSKTVLKPTAEAFFVLPTTAHEEFTESMKNEQFYLKNLCQVQPNPNKNANRFLYQLNQTEQQAIISNICIQQLAQNENKHLSYTKEYATLLKDFLLIF